MNKWLAGISLIVLVGCTQPTFTVTKFVGKSATQPTGGVRGYVEYARNQHAGFA